MDDPEEDVDDGKIEDEAISTILQPGKGANVSIISHALSLFGVLNNQEEQQNRLIFGRVLF